MTIKLLKKSLITGTFNVLQMFITEMHLSIPINILYNSKKSTCHAGRGNSDSKGLNVLWDTTPDKNTHGLLGFIKSLNNAAQYIYQGHSFHGQKQYYICL